jgi:hypothetical protein
MLVALPANTQFLCLKSMGLERLAATFCPQLMRFFVEFNLAVM